MKGMWLTGKTGSQVVMVYLLPSNPATPLRRLTPAPGKVQVWARVTTKGAKDLFVGSFYKPPTNNDWPFSGLKNVSSNALKTKDKIVILGGVFNARGFIWESQTMMDTCPNPSTRQPSILDLYLTKKPGLVNNNTTILGISDHDMVVVDSDVKPVIKRKQQGLYSNPLKQPGPV